MTPEKLNRLSDLGLTTQDLKNLLGIAKDYRDYVEAHGEYLEEIFFNATRQEKQGSKFIDFANLGAVIDYAEYIIHDIRTLQGLASRLEESIDDLEDSKQLATL